MEFLERETTELPQCRLQYPKFPARIKSMNSEVLFLFLQLNPSAVQSPTDGEWVIHYFAESGVMEFMEISHFALR
jgi:hypothetical protein